MAPEDVHKTAFVTSDGQFEFMKMPFGMVNSGATLVREIRKILEEMPRVASYIDNIVVHVYRTACRIISEGCRNCLAG